MTNSTLSVQELRRYEKQIAVPGLGLEGQEKLKSSKVMVIGAGGIGSATLQYLAVAGIGELGICDNTIIREENFHNQILYQSMDLGKHKAIIAKTKLEEINSFSKYSIFNIFISGENATEICKNYDLVINTTSDLTIAEILDETCFGLKIPLIYGLKLSGGNIIAVSNYPLSPRFKDQQAGLNSLSATSLNLQTLGSLGIIDGLIGNLMTIEAIKIITGVGEVLSGKYLLIDPLSLKIDYKSF